MLTAALTGISREEPLVNGKGQAEKVSDLREATTVYAPLCVSHSLAFSACDYNKTGLGEGSLRCNRKAFTELLFLFFPTLCHYSKLY